MVVATLTCQRVNLQPQQKRNMSVKQLRLIDQVLKIQILHFWSCKFEFPAVLISHDVTFFFCCVMVKFTNYHSNILLYQNVVTCIVACQTHQAPCKHRCRCLRSELSYIVPLSYILVDVALCVFACTCVSQWVAGRTPRRGAPGPARRNAATSSGRVDTQRSARKERRR